MARFNEIQVGRYNRFLQKLLGIKGGPPAPQLSSEFVPSWALFHGAENRYLEGWDRFGFSGSSGTPGAGNRGGIQLRNPSGSNAVVVVEKCSLFNSAAAVADTPLAEIITTNTDFTVSSYTLQRFDARGRKNPVSIISTTLNRGAITQQFWQGAFAANNMVEMIFTDIQEIPILPGDALVLDGGTLAQGISFNLWWRERFLEDSERA